jgi:hypothetical protein
VREEHDGGGVRQHNVEGGGGREGGLWVGRPWGVAPRRPQEEGVVPRAVRMRVQGEEHDRGGGGCVTPQGQQPLTFWV